MILRWINARDNTKWSLSMTSTIFPMSLFFARCNYKHWDRHYNSHAIRFHGAFVTSVLWDLSSPSAFSCFSLFVPNWLLVFPSELFSAFMNTIENRLTERFMVPRHLWPFRRRVHSKDTILLHTKLPVHFSNFVFLLVMICCICAANVKLITRRIKRNKEKI